MKRPEFWREEDLSRDYSEDWHIGANQVRRLQAYALHLESLQGQQGTGELRDEAYAELIRLKQEVLYCFDAEPEQFDRGGPIPVLDYLDRLKTWGTRYVPPLLKLAKKQPPAALSTPPQPDARDKRVDGLKIALESLKLLAKGPDTWCQDCNWVGDNDDLIEGTVDMCPACQSDKLFDFELIDYAATALQQINALLAAPAEEKGEGWLKPLEKLEAVFQEMEDDEASCTCATEEGDGCWIHDGLEALADLRAALQKGDGNG